MFRFGATGRNPEMIDSVQFLLYKQMSMLLFQSYMNAKHCGKNEVSVLNIVFVLKKYPYTLIKLLQYFSKTLKMFKYFTSVIESTSFTLFTAIKLWLVENTILLFSPI